MRFRFRIEIISISDINHIFWLFRHEIIITNTTVEFDKQTSTKIIFFFTVIYSDHCSIFIIANDNSSVNHSRVLYFTNHRKQLSCLCFCTYAAFIFSLGKLLTIKFTNLAAVTKELSALKATIVFDPRVVIAGTQIEADIRVGDALANSLQEGLGGIPSYFLPYIADRKRNRSRRRRRAQASETQRLAKALPSDNSQITRVVISHCQLTAA